MQKKTKCRKSYAIEAKEVADVLNVSESLVRKVRKAESSGVSLNTNKQKLIQLVDVWAEQNKSMFLKEIKKIVAL